MRPPTGIPTIDMKNETIELPPVYPMLAPIRPPSIKPIIQPKITRTILNKTVNIFIYDYLSLILFIGLKIHKKLLYDLEILISTIPFQM